MAVVCEETVIFLVGDCSKKFDLNSLPTIKQALSLFFYFHKVLKCTVRESSSCVIDRINAIYDKMGIPKMSKKHSLKKLESWFFKWKTLIKNSKRNTECENNKRIAFANELNEVFDISKKTITEMSDAGDHQSTDSSNYSTQKRKSNEKVNSQNIQKIDVSVEDEVVPCKIKKLKTLITPEVAAALDRAQVSDRNAVFIVSACADSFGMILDKVINHPREDYRDFIELIIMFLGSTPPRGSKFRTPGAVHHARWMAKALYSLKIYMFKSQFRLTAEEKKGLCDICLFIVKIYVKAWFCAPIAVLAPNHDLRFLQALSRYQEVNETVAKTAFKKCSHHLSYVNAELIGLAFFDETVSNECKQKMVIAVKCAKVTLECPSNLKEWENLKIEDFVCPKTLNLFHRFNISTSFMDQEVSDWESMPDFKDGKQILQHLKVTNDTAERAVALAQCPYDFQ
ncbi:hypothetical protein ALC62_01887 [Cyphomyrmex costatus]|uniref:Uncharacterized protein n=1 Tax=Cyphomyrmex costatus TaxID=456900 RepID=A0A151INU8_9HYME|nr:hypothetical protein ALC62_01887 [Cyphomyrmex costatus]